MNHYVDKAKLQEYTTKLNAKNKTIFAPFTAIGAPLVASTVADMTDEEKVYVYTGSETGYTAGNWYYYDGEDWVSGGVYNATAVVTDKTLSLEDEAADAKAVGDALENKANVDGAYEDLVAGQLLSKVGVEEKTPYLFRTSGGTADIGDREFDEIHGGTVAFNQIVKNGNFTSTSDWSAQNGTRSVSDGVLSYVIGSDIGNNTYTNFLYQNYISVVPSHVLFFGGEFNFAHSCSNSFWFIGGTNEQFILGDLTANTWTRQEKIVKRSATGSASTRLQVICRNAYTAGYSEGDIDKIKNVMLIDITQMFGSAIADYIYNLETNNAGAGVAYFKSLFPKPYYAYNAGTLLSVTGLSKHKMTAFNQWDEVWELGAIDSSGQNTPTNNSIRTKNYIPVIPNATYYYYVGDNTNGSQSPFMYDANKNYIGRYGYIKNRKFTIPSDCYYIRCGWPIAYGATYKNDVCINLSWDGERDGEYEEYKAYEYALDSDVVLRGIPKLDTNNKLYYDGDIYASDGTVTRRFAEINMGTLSWTLVSGQTNIFEAYVTGKKTDTKVICPKYASADASGVASMGDKSIGYSGNSTRVFVYDSAYSDAATFTSAMNGVYLVYELAEATTESADSFTYAQTVDDFGTEEYVIAEQSGVAMPVGHLTNYMNNLRAKLEMSPDSPDGDGDYIVRQVNGENSYVPLIIPTELPSAPSSDGNYVLKLTVASGVATYQWVSE